MHILEIKSLEALSAYESELDQLIAQSNDKCLYVTFDYIVSWIRSFDLEKDAILLLAKEKESIVGFCPLIRYRQTDALFGPLNSVRFAGEGLWGYTTIVTHKDCQEEVLRKMLSYLIETVPFDLLDIGPLLKSSKAYQILKKDIDKRKDLPSTIRVFKDAPHILPESDFKTYSTNMLTKKSTLADARRCLKRLSELGTVKVRKLNQECAPGELSAILTRFYEMYFIQWESNRFKKNSAFQKLYFEFAHAALRKKYAEISILLLDERIIAMHYGFVLSRCRYYFTPTYDYAYRKYSPGKVLLLQLIKDSFDEKIEFDFLNGLEQYKLDWTDVVQSRAVITVYKNKLFGRYDTHRKQLSSFKHKIVRKIKNLITP